METISNIENIREAISEGNVCLKFGAEWCGPCRVLETNIDTIAPEFPNINFIGVDVDDIDDESILYEYSIRNVPVLFFIKNGEIVKKEVGAMSKEYLSETLKEVF